MKMKHCLVVIQCRFNSTRLPGKAMYPLCGTPMVAFLLRRLKANLTNLDFLIVLATTRNPQDDLIASWGMQEGVEVLRGDEEDVLTRYIQCIDKYPSETVVRVTADNPLTCPEMLKLSAEKMKKEDVDYFQFQKLPIGAGIDIFSIRLLRLLNKKAISQEEREHIDLFVKKNIKQFNIAMPTVEGIICRPDINLTVDTEEDWKKINTLLNIKHDKPWNITIREAIEKMDSRNLR